MKFGEQSITRPISEKIFVIYLKNRSQNSELTSYEFITHLKRNNIYLMKLKIYNTLFR